MAPVSPSGHSKSLRAAQRCSAMPPHKEASNRTSVHGALRTGNGFFSPGTHKVLGLVALAAPFPLQGWTPAAGRAAAQTFPAQPRARVLIFPS